MKFNSGQFCVNFVIIYFLNNLRLVRHYGYVVTTLHLSMSDTYLLVI